MALIVIAAAIVSGWIELLPLAMLMGTFAVQTHLGVLPGVAAVSAIALGAVMTSAGSGAGSAVPTSRRRTVGIFSVTLCVLVVLWAVPACEAMTRTPGNLPKVWRCFVTGHREAQAFRSAYFVQIYDLRTAPCFCAATHAGRRPGLPPN
jgi:hypothetical protein